MDTRKTIYIMLLVGFIPVVLCMYVCCVGNYVVFPDTYSMTPCFIYAYLYWVDSSGASLLVMRITSSVYIRCVMIMVLPQNNNKTPTFEKLIIISLLFYHMYQARGG